MNPLSPDPQALDAAATGLGLRLVVLYGSHARQRPPPGPESDVDLAILGCPHEGLLKADLQVSSLFPGHNLDVVRLEDADPLFRQEIMSIGRLLWGDPDLFCEYRAYAFRDYVDSADLRRLEQTLQRRKLGWLEDQLHDS
ncbi:MULTISPECIES: nucleotidyltransferase domain-containing protein [unclassified Ectothiorhodospira]|jgi:predicted nucleotidyltransferase|uniref:nucleotidyltransferase domain-containing protein n=1 Tax=unclassified Ectothiorhodospira TaxID=2684909 RepID=UPI001EE7E663|nr:MULTISPECIES: nucleotidyltransferase domain-containing protein [unclassified Ectothiorhodospira]MCG5515659.1 nucleotidyltransferase domain-containing protein [Ectothiorhodospira sp. 9100]MCG5518817.1 nucleotidyltransferase domain-containing protein [Ectothiorhodospira sp. 9905]